MGMGGGGGWGRSGVGRSGVSDRVEVVGEAMSRVWSGNGLV